MENIKIEFTGDKVFTTRINGQPIVYDVTKAHPEWIALMLAKGIQRFANDKFSGESGQTKFDLCMDIAKAFNSGEAPQGVVGRSVKAKLPDDVALAVKNAKADLTLLFKQLTGLGKIADMVAAEPKVAAFFTVKDDKATWDDDKVQVWIGKQAEAGKRDYIAEAQAFLSAPVDDIDIDI